MFYAFALAVTIPMRFVSGYFCDRIDPKYAMAAAGLFMTFGSTVIWLGMINFGWTGFGPVILFALLQGIAIAANAIGLPIPIGRCFGERNFSKILGIVMTSFAVGLILGPNTMSLIFDKFGSYEMAYIITAVAGMISLLAALLCSDKCTT